MINIFSEPYFSDTDDNELVVSAQGGERSALEQLILNHQNWIYNIALRMVGNSEEAKDVTQEILIKILTKLSTFKGKSSFRTWLYRIVANHVINMKKRGMEELFASFKHHAGVVDGTPNMELPDPKEIPVDVRLLIGETKMNCMMGMLLCLDRSQRLVFTIGALLGANSDMGGAIMEISPDNFRQKLSRARKQLSNYMNEKCGLMNPENACSCARKTKALIEAGYVDPRHLQFHPKHLRRVKDIISEEAYRVDDMLDLRAQDIFRSHPFFEAPDYVQVLKGMIEQRDIQEMINFH